MILVFSARRSIIAAIAMVLLAGAVALAPSTASAQSREVSSKRGSNTGLNTNVFAELADEVTNEMLSSQSFQRILDSSNGKPKLVIGNISNRTDDESILVGDMARRISEVVIESGQVRWFEFGTDDYDLVVAPILTSISIGEGRRRELRLTLSLTLSDVNGEVMGRWSAEKTYVR